MGCNGSVVFSCIFYLSGFFADASFTASFAQKKEKIWCGDNSRRFIEAYKTIEMY
jgi:hypothetical protein